MVCSDVGSRGLDVPDMTHVIHLGPAPNWEVYCHRAGRAGRHGREVRRGPAAVPVTSPAVPITSPAVPITSPAVPFASPAFPITPPAVPVTSPRGS